MATSRFSAYTLPIDGLIIKPGFNERDPGPDLDEYLEELKTSIIEEGIKHPIKVKRLSKKDDLWPRDEKGNPLDGEYFMVTDGHCRITAARKAISEGHPIQSTPAMLEAQTAGEGDFLVTMLVGNMGRGHTPLEEARLIRRLIKYGYTRDNIARKRGKSVTWVDERLHLAAASPEVQEYVREGTVSPSTAAKAVQVHGTDQATLVLREALAQAKTEGKKKVTGREVNKKTPTPEDFELTDERTILLNLLNGMDWGKLSTPVLRKIGKLTN